MRFLTVFTSLVLFASIASAQVMFVSYSCKGKAVINGRKGEPVPYLVVGISRKAEVGTLQISENNQALGSPQPVNFSQQDGVLTFSNTSRTEALTINTATKVGSYDKHIPDANFVSAPKLFCARNDAVLAPPQN